MATIETGSGATIYYEEHGSGEPLLCVTGLATDTLGWALQVPTFSQRHRTVIFDNRDVGQSSMVTGSYEVADMARDALDLADAIGLDSFHLLGLSMGGAIAQELALTAPEWVRSLTLVSSFARPDARLEAILEAWRLIYPILGPRNFAQQSWPWLFTWRFFERPSAFRNLQRYAENYPRPQEPDAFIRQARVTIGQDRRERLAALRIPTLVIAGAEDALVPPYLGRELADHIPGARYAALPGVGHSANLEGRAEFNRLVKEFRAAQD